MSRHLSRRALRRAVTTWAAKHGVDASRMRPEQWNDPVACGTQVLVLAMAGSDGDIGTAWERIEQLVQRGTKAFPQLRLYLAAGAAAACEGAGVDQAPAVIDRLVITTTAIAAGLGAGDAAPTLSAGLFGAATPPTYPEAVTRFGERATLASLVAGAAAVVQILGDGDVEILYDLAARGVTRDADVDAADLVVADLRDRNG